MPTISGQARQEMVNAIRERYVASSSSGLSSRRPPRPEDLIVPSRLDRPRNVNHMLRRFHEDLERVGLHARRQHDTRRTFISIARADGARPDILRWATHGPTDVIVDDYTTPPWATLCEEAATMRIRLLEGTPIELPTAATAAAGGESTVSSPGARSRTQASRRGPSDRSRSREAPINAVDPDRRTDRARTVPLLSLGPSLDRGRICQRGCGSARYTTRYSRPNGCNKSTKWRDGRDSTC